jgi:3-oxoadipate enol-lactonase
LLNHRIDGSRGPRLLLLHPIGLDLTCFDRLVAALQGRYAILRVDANGHGGSPPTPGPADLDAYAAEIHATITSLEWVPTAVIGFSFGGMLAQTLALAQPPDVDALVIGACASTFSAEARRAIAARGEKAAAEGMAAVVDATLERWFSRDALGTDAAAAVRRRLLSDNVGAWVRAWRAIAGIDTAPRLGSIAVPTLCIAGGADRSAPPPVVEAIARAIPSARFEVIPRAPHMLFIEQPHEVAALLDDFLGRGA